MKMTSMKRSQGEKKEANAAMAPSATTENYPYGLCIRLGNEELEKLGVATLPAVGESYMIMAMATVKSVSSSEYQEGDKRRELELQITELALGQHGQEANPAEMMYPKKA